MSEPGQAGSTRAVFSSFNDTVLTKGSLLACLAELGYNPSSACAPASKVGIDEDDNEAVSSFDPTEDCIPAAAFQRIEDHHGHTFDAEGCSINTLVLHRTLGIGVEAHMPGDQLGVLHSDSDDDGITGITTHHQYSVYSVVNSTADGGGQNVVMASNNGRATGSTYNFAAAVFDSESSGLLSVTLSSLRALSSGARSSSISAQDSQSTGANSSTQSVVTSLASGARSSVSSSLGTTASGNDASATSSANGLASGPQSGLFATSACISSGPRSLVGASGSSEASGTESGVLTSDSSNSTAPHAMVMSSTSGTLAAGGSSSAISSQNTQVLNDRASALSTVDTVVNGPTASAIAAVGGNVTGQGALAQGSTPVAADPWSVALSGGHADAGAPETFAHGQPGFNGGTHVGFRGATPVIAPVLNLASPTLGQDIANLLKDVGLAA